MKLLKISKNNRSANGLLLQELDVVQVGGNTYLTVLEKKKLVVKRFDEESQSYKYLQNWTGKEIILRDKNAEHLKEVILANKWFS